MSKLVKAVPAIAGALILAGALSTAAPAPGAEAATRCSAPGYSKSSGGVAVNCYAIGVSYSLRVKVTCAAWAPFPSWTKYSNIVGIGPTIGQSLYWPASVFPSCPSPAASYVSVEYF